MRKIPTLFMRDPENMKHVLPQVTPGCEWVMEGEGRATRKYDGTCVLIRRDGLAIKGFARREVKPGKQPPEHFIEADHDETTGKRVGWEPIKQSGFYVPFGEAVAHAGHDLMPGTYELCGPKVQGNPEGFTWHTLVSHDLAERYEDVDHPQDYEWLYGIMATLPWEGIVWHHPDGRMAKLKRRDFA